MQRFLWLMLCLPCLSPLIGEVDAASIVITCDNEYRLYVNGAYIGQQDNTDGDWGWDVPETWHVDLQAGTNVIAVWSYNWSVEGGAGLIAEIHSDDGSVIVTDESWRARRDSVVGWTEVGFDDSSWDAPSVTGATYDEIPWIIFAPAIAEFSQNGAQWIWWGPLTFTEGYGYLSPHQVVVFRRSFTYSPPVPGETTSWGRVKALYTSGGVQ